MNAQLPTREELWRHYRVHVDLYKHYLKMALEFNAFYYAITGAIVSYFLAHRNDPASGDRATRYALLLPIAMSVLFGVLFAFGAKANVNSRKEVIRVINVLGLSVWPEFAVLSVFLAVCAVLMAGMATVLVLFFFDEL